LSFHQKRSGQQDNLPEQGLYNISSVEEIRKLRRLFDDPARA